MSIDVQLYEGESICLAPIDHEKDPEIEARWTHDSEYLRLLGGDVAMPQSVAQLKKRYEAIEKEAGESRRLFHYTIRTRGEDRLVGFARLEWIDWSNSSAAVRLGIGDASDRGRGYGTQALRLLLRYAFDELNLYRLMAFVPEYNLGALRLFQRFGFVEEVRRRQALNRDGRRWDLIHLGLLQEEWKDAKEPSSG